MTGPVSGADSGQASPDGPPPPSTGSGQQGAPAAGGSSGAPSPASTSAGGGKLPADTSAALQAVLNAEQAALWAYGLVASKDPDDASTVATIIDGHQVLRDLVAYLLVQGGGTPAGPAPAYSTPKPITDKASALALALVIESDCATAWRVLIGSTDDSGLRGTALAGLTDSALRMVTWKKLAKITPVTTAFPGGQ